VIAVLTGSYTPDTGGDGVGLALLRFDPRTGALEAEPHQVPAGGASFLAAHPRLDVVYCTNESESGGVSAFRFDGTRPPVPLGAPLTSGGVNPCHLSVHPDGRWLLTANYGSPSAAGCVAVHRLDDQGRPVELTDAVEHQGSGPVPGRQDGSHAHQVILDPAGRFVLATDLGADTVFAYRLDPDTGTLDRAAASPLRPGSGPRHLAFAPSGDIVWSTDELSSTVTGHRYDAATGTLSEGVYVAATSSVETNLPGGIVVSPDGRFVWVTNRGADTVAAFRTDGLELHPIGEYDSGGDWPRGLSWAAGHLLVANQYGGTITALRIRDDGGLDPAGPPLPIPSVVCVLPVE
jgi:6-phosphogluconolactonase